MKTRPKNSPGGFTLIELLVAMAITTVIVTILVSITALSLDTWNRNRSEVRAARQGKAMVDTMARDFESMVVRKGNSFEWLHAESKPPADGPNDHESPNAIDLIFFSAATDRYDGQIGVDGVDLGGDVSAVGYQLAYKDPIGSEDTEAFKTFVLYRKLVNPDETFAQLLGQNDLKVAFTGEIDENTNFICENVYEFTITFHLNYTEGNVVKAVRVPVGQGTGSTQSFSVRGNGITDTGGNEITGISGEGNVPVSGASIKSAQLTGVEISLTVLTDSGLKQLRSRTMNDTEKAEFVAKNSYRYSKLVPVPGGS